MEPEPWVGKWNMTIYFIAIDIITLMTNVYIVKLSIVAPLPIHDDLLSVPKL